MFLKKISLMVLLCTLSYCTTFDEIEKFSTAICDNIGSTGEITSTKIKATVEGNSKALSKILGVSIRADGTIEYENKQYEGLPYEDLSKQMQDSRQCKKELAFLILNKDNTLNKSVDAIYYLHNESTGNTGLYKEISFPLDEKKIICFVESRTKVEKIIEKRSFNISFTQVKILEGDCQGSIGWTEQGNLKRVIK